MFRDTIRLTGILAAVFMIASCDAGSFIEPEETGGAGNPVQVAEITIEASLSMVAEDDTIPLEAAVLDQDGAPIADAEIQWSSTDEDVAHVEPDGSGSTLIAGKPGTTTLTASYADVSTSATVEVHKRPVDLVYVSGSGQKGDPATELADSLAVRIIDKRGDAVSDVAISFVVVSGGGSASPQAGTTDAEGRLSAAWTLGASGPQVVEARVSAAQARVNHVKDSVVVFTARFSDATGESQVASVTVSPPSDTVVAGSTAQLRATVRDADGNELTGRSVRWSSSDTTVATVDDGGVVAGRARGHIAALAKVDGVSGAADVTVADPADGNLIIASSVDTLFGIGTSASFTAEAWAADGNLIPDPDVQWTSSNPDIATVDSMGTVIARALGVTVISASAVCCDSGAFVDVTVVDSTIGEPVSVAASPSSHRFTEIGATAQISATARDSEGNIVNGTDFTYSSTDPSVVSVDEVGTMTANELGTAAVIIATACCSAADTLEAQVDTAAGTPFFQDNFESYTDGQSLNQEGDGSFTYTTSYPDISTEMAYTGSQSLRFDVKPNYPSSYNNEQRFNLGRQVTEIWAEYYLYYPDGTEGIPGVERFTHNGRNFKFLRLWGFDYGDKSKVGFETRGTGTGTGAGDDEYLYHTMRISQGPWGSPNVWDWLNDSSRGQWLQVRFYMKIDDGSSNGIVRLWKDGVLELERTGLDQDPESNTAGVGYWDTGYLFGWANDGSESDSAIYMDDLKFYDVDPGW